MKSLRDEIRTDVRDTEDGFDFIVSEANDFIRASRGFHRGTAAISLIIDTKLGLRGFDWNWTGEARVNLNCSQTVGIIKKVQRESLEECNDNN